MHICTEGERAIPAVVVHHFCRARSAGVGSSSVSCSSGVEVVEVLLPVLSTVDILSAAAVPVAFVDRESSRGIRRVALAAPTTAAAVEKAKVASMATRQNSRSDDIDGRAQRARPRRSVGGWNVLVGAVVAFVGIFDCRRMLISLVLATALRYRIFGCRDNFVRATLLLCCVIVLLLLYLCL